MRFVPHAYQARAIDWVLDRPRCCLFLDMGLGKSVITLTAVRRLIDYGEVSRVLIAAPKKVAETTWSDEASKWDHLSGLRVSRVIGGRAARLAALEAEADVYVIGRDNLVWLVETFRARLPFDMLVLDELTGFKSPSSRRFKAVRAVSPACTRVVGLTGTPSPNGLTDLWAQLYCVDLGERLGKSVTRYRETYFSVYRWNNIPVRYTPRKGAEEAIRGRIADICLSMQARDYLTLPAMMEHSVYVALPERTMAAYRRFEHDRVMEFRQRHGDGEEGRTVAGSAAALMSKLAQFANGAVYDDDGHAHTVHGEKTARLAELIETAGGPVLVFYQFRHDVAGIRAALPSGLRVEEYSGDGTLQEWNGGRIDVLLAHPASTGYGLNMQGGGHVIVWMGTGWNLEYYQQANARLHRQGQDSPVMVYRLLCRGTVDERAAAAIDGKKDMQRALMDGLRDLLDEYREEGDGEGQGL